jgi:hypothetical protein
MGNARPKKAIEWKNGKNDRNDTIMSEKNEMFTKIPMCPLMNIECKLEGCQWFDAEKGYQCCAIVSLVICLNKLAGDHE